MDFIRTLRCWHAGSRSRLAQGAHQAPPRKLPERNFNFSQEAHNRARRPGEFGSFQFVDIFPSAERSKESGASAKTIPLVSEAQGSETLSLPTDTPIPLEMNANAYTLSGLGVYQVI